MRRSPEKYFAKHELSKENVIKYITAGRAPTADSFAKVIAMCEGANMFEEVEAGNVADFNLGKNIDEAMAFAKVLSTNQFDEANLSMLYRCKVACSKRDTIVIIGVIAGIAIVSVAGVIIYKKVNADKAQDDLPPIDDTMDDYISDVSIGGNDDLPELPVN